MQPVPAEKDDAATFRLHVEAKLDEWQRAGILSQALVTLIHDHERRLAERPAKRPAEDEGSSQLSPGQPENDVEVVAMDEDAGPAPSDSTGSQRPNLVQDSNSSGVAGPSAPPTGHLAAGTTDTAQIPEGSSSGSPIKKRRCDADGSAAQEQSLTRKENEDVQSVIGSDGNLLKNTQLIRFFRIMGLCSNRRLRDALRLHAKPLNRDEFVAFVKRVLAFIDTTPAGEHCLDRISVKTRSDESLRARSLPEKLRGRSATYFRVRNESGGFDKVATKFPDYTRCTALEFDLFMKDDPINLGGLEAVLSTVFTDALYSTICTSLHVHLPAHESTDAATTSTSRIDDGAHASTHDHSGNNTSTLDPGVSGNDQNHFANDAEDRGSSAFTPLRTRWQQPTQGKLAPGGISSSLVNADYLDKAPMEGSASATRDHPRPTPVSAGQPASTDENSGSLDSNCSSVEGILSDQTAEMEVGDGDCSNTNKALGTPPQLPGDASPLNSSEVFHLEKYLFDQPIPDDDTFSISGETPDRPVSAPEQVPQQRTGTTPLAVTDNATNLPVPKETHEQVSQQKTGSPSVSIDTVTNSPVPNGNAPVDCGADITIPWIDPAAKPTGTVRISRNCSSPQPMRLNPYFKLLSNPLYVQFRPQIPSPPPDESSRRKRDPTELQRMGEKRRRHGTHSGIGSPRLGTRSPIEAEYLCQTCGAISTHRHCDACRIQRRRLQDTAPMEHCARDECAITAERVFSEEEGFARIETKKFLTMISALPLSLRKVLRQYLTFDDMSLARFRECCLDWANIMHVDCSRIPLFTHANAKNPAVRKRSFESKTKTRNDGRKPKTGWSIWDDNKKMWFRCFTENPPWEECFQLEVITAVESDEVVVYTGAVGRFLRQDGLFESFVKSFEPRFFVPVVPQVLPMMVKDQTEIPRVHSTTDGSPSRVRGNKVTIFVTVRGCPNRTETHHVMCDKMWGWSMNDVIDKLGPSQYPRDSNTKFELRDVLLDESSFLVKPGQVIFDYSAWPDIPVNVMLCKELVVIPARAISQ